MKYFLIFNLTLALLLASCSGRPADLLPEQDPQVGITTINGKDARNSELKIWAPSRSLGTTPVEVTASDDTFIGKVELFLNGSSVGVLEANKDKKIFQNPFSFSVGFEPQSGGETASLRAVATDNANNTTSQEIKVFVDSTPPVVEIQPIQGLAGATAGSFQGNVIVSGRAFDSESGIASDISNKLIVKAYINDDTDNPINVDPDDKTVLSNFSTQVGGLSDGVHTIYMYAYNGANVIATDVVNFVIDNP
jgi:hypothetical protein